MISEERVLCPAPFTGGADDDPVEFWRRFKNYLECKQIINDADKLRLAKAMCVDEAGDWSDNLDSTSRSNFQAFSHAFEQRWTKPSVLRFRSARDMFSIKQQANESVDAYASRTRKLANKIDVSDETMRYAFVSSLKPKIASFVLSKEPETMNQALDAARVAEMSIGEGQEAENNELTAELAEMRLTLKRMADRYDSLTPSAPLQNECARSPARRVTFEGDRREENKPRSPSPAVSNEYRYGNRGGQFSPNRGFRGNNSTRRGFRGRNNNGRILTRGSLNPQRGSRGFSPFRGKWRFGNAVEQQYTQQYNEQYQPSQEQPGAVAGPVRCNKCGLAPHENILMCPANNRMCLFCCKFGHFARTCRLLRAQDA